MATKDQVLNITSAYQIAISNTLADLERLVTLRRYYDSFELADDGQFPEDAYKESSFSEKLDRDSFRLIVANLDEVSQIVDKVSGRRSVFSKILDGIPE